MPIPEPPWRCPTRKAIDSLAERFNLPNTPDMQDWEWEVADPSRIGEFLAAYESGELSDDERFTLMETIFQSFEELPDSIGSDPRWAQVLDILDSHFELHAYSIWYWSDLENENGEDSWRVTPFLRQVLAKHQRILELRLAYCSGFRASDLEIAMLHVGNERVPMCSGHGPTRRSFLQAGSAGLMGLSLPSLANPVTGDFSCN